MARFVPGADHADWGEKAMFSRRFLLIVFLIVFAWSLPTFAESAESESTAAWNGTWVGLIGRLSAERAPIAVTISQGKVVGYTINGAPFNIEYSSLNSQIVRFGDHDNYAVKLTRTDKNSARARVHGRLGYGFAVLTRQ
jgi:hypothetical protein